MGIEIKISIPILVGTYCDNGIQSGRNRSGNNPGYQSDHGGYAKTQNNILNTQDHHQASEGNKSHQEYQQDSRKSTNEAEEDGFKQKLEQDEVIFGTQGFLKSDDAGAFFHGDEHDVGDAESAYKD